MRIGYRAACVAVAAVTAGACAPSASAETITFDVPFSGLVPNPCTGEEMQVTGTQHFKATGSITLSGSKSQLETNLTGAKGIGVVTGARYVMNDQTSDMQHAEFDPFGNAQMTMENTTIMNRQGEGGALVMGDDWRLHVLTHLTISSGVTRSDKSDLRADCR
jgi:hypothetical protein